MNDPIISPWIFYFIDVSVKIQMIAVFCCVVFLFLTGNAYAEYLDNNRRFNLWGNDDYKKEFYYYRKLLKIHLTSFIIFSFSRYIYSLSIYDIQDDDNTTRYSC